MGTCCKHMTCADFRPLVLKGGWGSQGFEKLPRYEEVLTAFLLGVIHGEMTDGGYGVASFAVCSQVNGDDRPVTSI